MLFAAWFLLSSVMAHLRVPRGMLMEFPGSYFMDMVIEGLAERTDLLETVYIFREEFLAKEVNSVLMRHLNDPIWHQAYLRALIHHDHNENGSFFAAEESRHILVVTDKLTAEDLEVMSGWDVPRLEAFSQLVVSGQSEYLKLLRERCPDLGMVLLENEQTLSQRLNFIQRQIFEMALERNVHPLEELDIDFISRLTRWWSLASRDKQVSLLRFLLSKLPSDVLMKLPDPALRQMFSHEFVLEVISPIVLGPETLVFLATLIQKTPRFWATLGSRSHKEYLQLDWPEFLDDMIDGDAKRLLQQYFLPALLNTSDIDDAFEFLQNYCQVAPESGVTCVVGRDDLDDLSALVEYAAAHLWTLNDVNAFGASLLVLRFLQPSYALPYALIKKTLLLHLGDLLPLSMLSASHYPHQMDVEVIRPLVQRLMVSAPVEMSFWHELFERMPSWLPILIPNLLSDDRLYFVGDVPTEAMLQCRFTPTGSLLLRHGLGHLLMNAKYRQLAHWLVMTPSVAPYLTDVLNRQAQEVPMDNLLYLFINYRSHIWDCHDEAFSHVMVRLAEYIVERCERPELAAYPALAFTERIVNGELRQRMDAALSKFI